MRREKKHLLHTETGEKGEEEEDGEDVSKLPDQNL